VLVERGKISETDRVRLNRLGSDLGEFTVQDFQNLCLDRVRIQV